MKMLQILFVYNGKQMMSFQFILFFKTFFPTYVNRLLLDDDEEEENDNVESEGVIDEDIYPYTYT